MGTKQVYAALLIFVLTLASCSNTDDYSNVERGRFFYLKVLPEPENGTLILSHNKAESGAQVKVYILPDPGYVLDIAELKFRTYITAKTNPESIHKQSRSYYASWNMRAADTAVTAKFVPKWGGGTSGNPTYTVSADRNIKNGFIVPDIRDSAGDNVDEGHAGSKVIVHVFPSDGYVLKPGSIKITNASSGNPLTGLNLTTELPYTFDLPSADVLITAEFETTNFSGIFTNAASHLKAGKYDLAAKYYKDAYNKLGEASGAQQRNEVIFYHSLGKLASILIDPDVRTFLGSGVGRLHMEVVPTTLEDWFCDSDNGWTGLVDNNEFKDDRWYRRWSGIDYQNPKDGARKGYDIKGDPVLWLPSTEITEDIILPKFEYRSGMAQGIPGSFASSFADYAIINENQSNTRQKFFNLVFWVMLSQWRDLGFNTMFERIEENLFGRDFEAAAAIAQTLPADAKVLLYPNLKNRFKSPPKYDAWYQDPDSEKRAGLERFYGTGQTYVGKAELDYIFGTLRLIKAALRYCRSYDWTADVRPMLLDDFDASYGPDQIIHAMLHLPESNPNYEVYWNNTLSISKILPIKNRFLDVKSSGFIASSKSEFTKALNMINSSMSYWFASSASGSKPGSSNLSHDGHDNYRWVRSMFSTAKNALDSNGTFYFNTKMPNPGGTWPTEATAGAYGLNMGAFFTPGVFSLKNLLTLEPGVYPAPKLYKIRWYPTTNIDTGVVTATLQPFSAIPVSAHIPDDDGELVYGNNVPYMLYSFEVNTGYLRTIFPKGFEQIKYSPTASSGHSSGPSGDLAFLYQVFPTIPLWPERPTYFTGPGNFSNGNPNRSAQYLYNYYHGGSWYRKR